MWRTSSCSPVHLQYEAPTGYSNIFEGHGNGLLGVYGILGKEFWDNWHFVSTFGQNIALNNSNSGYFMVTGHIDRRSASSCRSTRRTGSTTISPGRTFPELTSRAAACSTWSHPGHGAEAHHQRRGLQL